MSQLKKNKVTGVNDKRKTSLRRPRIQSDSQVPYSRSVFSELVSDSTQYLNVNQSVFKEEKLKENAKRKRSELLSDSTQHLNVNQSVFKEEKLKENERKRKSSFRVKRDEKENFKPNFIQKKPNIRCAVIKPASLLKASETSSNKSTNLPVLQGKVDTKNKQEDNKLEKKKIVRRKPKLALSRKRILDATLLSDSLYDKEYCDMNCQILIHKEELSVRVNAKQTINIDEESRMSIIDWMINLQQSLQFEDNTLFVAIKLFDRILIELNFPPSKSVLVSVVSLWIATKLCEKSIHLSTLCHIGDLSSDEIIKTEWIILFKLDFKLIDTEPDTFLYYFIQDLNLTSDKTLFDCSLYILHLVFYLHDYSSMRPSLLAAMAIYSSIIALEYDRINFMQCIIMTRLKMTQEKFLTLSQRIHKDLFKDSNKLYLQAIQKFSQPSYSCTALRFK